MATKILEFFRGLYAQQQTSSERNKSVYVLALSLLFLLIFSVLFMLAHFVQNVVETRSISRACCTAFYELHRNLGKKYTLQHFKSENVAASTIYHILRSPSTARKQGSVRPAKIMDAKGLRSLSHAMVQAFWFGTQSRCVPERMFEENFDPVSSKTSC